MNPLKNASYLLRIAKGYLLDINRIWKFNEEQLKRYQNKKFKEIFRYAWDIPIYRKKYKKCGIGLNDIKGIEDIQKLPVISKDDIRESYPEGIKPKNYDKHHWFLLSTSGSTGSPFFMYYDRYTAIKALFGYVRALKAYGGNWNKSKIALIADTKPGGIENLIFKESISPFLNKIISIDNIKTIYVGEKIEKIIEELNKFQPEFIGSDPTMFRMLSLKKNEGFLKDVNPRVMFSSGSMIDNYSRLCIEKSFDAKLYDVYASTEAGVVGFQCLKEPIYHINSDLIYTEFLDDNQNSVDFGQPGNIVITRLFGKGTPIIRYSGLNDIVVPINRNAGCGLKTQMIKHIEGRAMEFIKLPNGKTIAPFHLTTIPASVMSDCNNFKIKQFQIIQHKIDEIEILIVIDKKLRNIGPSVKNIIYELEKRYIEKTESLVKITINEVDEIDKDCRSDHMKLIISKIN